MNKKDIRTYRQFRDGGYTALFSYHAVQTLKLWDMAEEMGAVRIGYQYEEENYFDVYGEPDSQKEKDEIIRLIDTYGCYYVYTEAREFPGDDFQIADGIGMIIGEPLDPIANAYVIDLMDAALQTAGYKQ